MVETKTDKISSKTFSQQQPKNLFDYTYDRTFFFITQEIEIHFLNPFYKTRLIK
tara:strand:+ start:549 stop:710 length:162 start_codon:yes stop_codon:yes gene_type:complete